MTTVEKHFFGFVTKNRHVQHVVPFAVPLTRICFERSVYFAVLKRIFFYFYFSAAGHWEYRRGWRRRAGPEDVLPPSEIVSFSSAARVRLGNSWALFRGTLFYRASAPHSPSTIILLAWCRGEGDVAISEEHRSAAVRRSGARRGQQLAAVY